MNPQRTTVRQRQTTKSDGLVYHVRLGAGTISALRDSREWFGGTYSDSCIIRRAILLYWDRLLSLPATERAAEERLIDRARGVA